MRHRLILSQHSPIPVDKRERRLVLTLRLPKSASQAQESIALIEAACNLVDALELGHAKLTNTTVAKLRSTRNQLDKELDEEANRWKKEEVCGSVHLKFVLIQPCRRRKPVKLLSAKPSKKSSTSSRQPSRKRSVHFPALVN